MITCKSRGTHPSDNDVLLVLTYSYLRGVHAGPTRRDLVAAAQGRGAGDRKLRSVRSARATFE